MKLKVYYAHSMHLYNTVQEKRDIELLEQLGYEVVNPNSQKTSDDILKLKNDKIENYMDYFRKLILECDVLAYRAHVDLKIPAGVWKEIGYAKEASKLIFELPTILRSRELSVEETRDYLQYNGQR